MNRRTTGKIARFTALLAAVLALLAGCSGSSYKSRPITEPNPHQCIIDPLPVDTGISSGGGKVTGTIRVFCGAPVAAQNIVLKLLYSPRDAAQVTEVAGAVKTFTGPAPKLQPSLQVPADCLAGWWRLDATVSITTTLGDHQEGPVTTRAFQLSKADCGKGVPATTTSAPGKKAQCVVSYSPADGPGPRTGDSHTIGGAAQVTCPGVVEVQSFNVIFYVEWHSTGAAWHAEDQDYMTAPGEDKIVYGSCKVGTWRFRVEISGSDGNGNPLSITPTVSQEQYISRCP